MHTRTAELLAYADRTREELRAAVDSVPAEQRDQRPGPGRWSVAEVLEHLEIVERRITSVCATWLSQGRDAGLSPETDEAPVLPVRELDRILDRGRKITSSQSVQPSGELSAAAALLSLEASRQNLRDLILAGDGLALGAIVRPHPVFGPLNLYGWIAFIIGHEARHAAQIREVGDERSGAA